MFLVAARPSSWLAQLSMYHVSGGFVSRSIHDGSLTLGMTFSLVRSEEVLQCRVLSSPLIHHLMLIMSVFRVSNVASGVK